MNGIRRQAEEVSQRFVFYTFGIDAGLQKSDKGA